jgi:hypothetical protein
MWDTVEVRSSHLSHDPLCLHCGHAGHHYLPCDNGCGCGPHQMPGEIVREPREVRVALLP